MIAALVIVSLWAIVASLAVCEYRDRWKSEEKHHDFWEDACEKANKRACSRSSEAFSTTMLVEKFRTLLAEYDAKRKEAAGNPPRPAPQSYGDRPPRPTGPFPPPPPKKPEQPRFAVLD